MKFIKTSIVALFIIAIALFLAFNLFLGFENKNVLFPYLDTQFPAGFDKSKFEQIKIGMSVTTVESIIGKPITYFVPERTSRREGDTSITVMYNQSQVKVSWDANKESWTHFNMYVYAYYSQDGNWKYGDYAWKEYTLIYDANGRVEEITNRWAYD